MLKVTMKPKMSNLVFFNGLLQYLLLRIFPSTSFKSSRAIIMFNQRTQYFSLKFDTTISPTKYKRSTLLLRNYPWLSVAVLWYTWKVAMDGMGDASCPLQSQVVQKHGCCHWTWGSGQKAKPAPASKSQRDCISTKVNKEIKCEGSKMTVVTRQKKKKNCLFHLNTQKRWA